MQVLQEDNEIKGIRDRQQLMSENLQRCTLQLVNTEVSVLELTLCSKCAAYTGFWKYTPMLKYQVIVI